MCDHLRFDTKGVNYIACIRRGHQIEFDLREHSSYTKFDLRVHLFIIYRALGPGLQLEVRVNRTFELTDFDTPRLYCI